jgi:hypothetical protein
MKVRMFFLRKKQHISTFNERLDACRRMKFEIGQGPNGATRITRGNLAADVRPAGDSAEILNVGVLVGSEIGELTDLGYQKIWMTPSGKRLPAGAAHLRALHDFLEDLREALGVTSLYNEGLGSVNEHHLYDRVVDRDDRREKKPWEVALR